jgi:hypothetical protein
MFLKSGDARYLDVFEQTLYNGLLSGVSVKGDTFFYQNPLEAGPNSRNNARSAYFDVACCPANLARLVAQLPGLIYAHRGDEVFVNLYVDSTADIQVGGRLVTLAQTTAYPWDGTVSFVVTPSEAGAFALKLRRPGWLGDGPFPSDLYRFTEPVGDEPAITVNGRPAPVRIEGGWMTVARSWSAGDRVQLSLPMPVRRVAPHPSITDTVGKLALQRGPIVYALEGVDHGGKVLGVPVPAGLAFQPAFRADLLGGVATLTATVDPAGSPQTLTAIPYFAWANRGRGEMVLWMPAGAR